MGRPPAIQERQKEAQKKETWREAFGAASNPARGSVMWGTTQSSGRTAHCGTEREALMLWCRFRVAQSTHRWSR